MKITRTPKTENRNIALTTSTGSGFTSAYVQPWDTKNLPKGAGARETLTATVIGALAADCADVSHFPARVTQLGTGRDVSDRDPIARIFNTAPRVGMSASDVRAHIVYQLEYTGECYVVIVKDTLTPLLAASVDVLPAKPGQHNRDGSPALVAGYVIKDDRGREIGRYDAAGLAVSGSAEGQLVRIFHPYPGHPYRADAPISHAALSIDTLHFARQASAHVLKNAGQPSGIVQVTDPGFTEESITAFDNRLNSRLSDVSQRGKILVVSSEVTYTDVTPGDPSSGIGSLSDMARRDLLAVWGMPESRLGLGGARTYENQRVEAAHYIRHTVMHRLGLIASALNQILRARGVELTFEGLAPELGEQQTELVARARDLFQAGIISRDEARAMVGYDPATGGDRFANEAAPAAGTPARGFLPFDGAAQAAAAPSGSRSVSPSTWVAEYDALVTNIEDRFAVAVQDLHVSIFRAIDRKLSRIGRAFHREDPAPKVGAGDLYNVEQAAAEMTTSMRPLVEKAAENMAGWAYDALTGKSAGEAAWKQIASNRLSRLVKGDGEYVGWAQQLADDVTDALTAGYQAGESVGQIAARIADKLGVDPANVKTIQERALTIARTEANGLANDTSYAAMTDSGVVSKKRWYSIGDVRTRGSHAEANGQTVPMNAKFVVGGTEMERPHDPNAPGREVINCRCRLIPVVE